MIEVHGKAVLRPHKCEKMEAILHRIGRLADTCLIGITTVVERLAPMGCAIEIAVLQTLADAVLMPHLHDVYLTATRPYDLTGLRQLGGTGIDRIVVAQIAGNVVAQHPKSRPKTIGGAGESNTSLHLAILHRDLVLRIEAGGSGGAIAIILAASGKHQAALTRHGMVLYRYIARGVVLHLVVAAPTGIVLDIPKRGIERIAIKVVLPNERVGRLGTASRKKGYHA